MQFAIELHDEGAADLPELRTMNETFTNTETDRPVTLPPKDNAGESPEGPGRDGNKPLMRNRTAIDRPSPTGTAGGNILADPIPALSGILSELRSAQTEVLRWQNRALAAEKKFWLTVASMHAGNQYPDQVAAALGKKESMYRALEDLLPQLPEQFSYQEIRDRLLALERFPREQVVHGLTNVIATMEFHQKLKRDGEMIKKS